MSDDKTATCTARIVSETEIELVFADATFVLHKDWETNYGFRLLDENKHQMHRTVFPGSFMFPKRFVKRLDVVYRLVCVVPVIALKVKETPTPFKSRVVSLFTRSKKKTD